MRERVPEVVPAIPRSPHSITLRRPIWAIGTLALSVVSFLSPVGCTRTLNTSTRACVLSVHAALAGVPVDRVIAETKLSSDWTDLSAKDVRALVAIGAAAKGIDCEEASDGTPIDNWENPLRVRTRHPSPAAAVSFHVSSAGSDGVTGTEDDIVSSN